MAKAQALKAMRNMQDEIKSEPRQVLVNLPVALVKELDAWCAKQLIPPRRSQAVAHMVKHYMENYH